jgi:hypothetical protein
LRTVKVAVGARRASTRCCAAESRRVGLELAFVVEVASLGDALALETRELGGERGVGIRRSEVCDEIPIGG